MATILVFQHSDIGGPGRLGLTLRDHGFKLDIRRVDLPIDEGGDPVPADLDEYQGIVSLGGPQDPDEHHPWLLDELLRIHEAHTRGIPIVGLCLGHQLMARALGGELGELDKPEVGFHAININTTGQVESMLAGVPWKTQMFCHHGYHVTEIPEGAVTLAGSESCKHQIVCYGPTSYSFQPHIEADRSMIDAIYASAPDLNDASRVNEGTLMQQAGDYYARSAEVMDRLCMNLATLLFPTRDLITA